MKMKSVALWAIILCCLQMNAQQQPTSSLWVANSGVVGQHFKLYGFTNGIPLFNPSNVTEDANAMYYTGKRVVTLTGNSAAADGCATFSSGVLGSTGLACGSGSGSSIVLKTNGVNNPLQSILNLTTSGGATATSAGDGSVNLAADAAGAAATVQTNLTAEAVTARAAETANANAISAEATTARAAETANATAISNEVTNRGTAVIAEATARSNADALLVPLIQKGAANGVASLDSGGRVPVAQLPAPSETRMRFSALCSSGAASPSSFGVFDNNQPGLGCFSTTASSLGYMAYYSTDTTARFASDVFFTPANFTSADLTIVWAASTLTTGSTTWSVAYSCSASPSAPTYNTAVTVTSSPSATAGNLVQTSVLSGFVTNGVNSCGPLQNVYYTVSRGLSDGFSDTTRFVGAILTVRKSQ